MAGDVTITITGDAESLKRSLGEANSSLQSFAASAQKVGERATSIGRSMTIGVTLPLLAVGKAAYDELQQSAAASAQTTAAIKSTGGAAHVTAQQVDELSSSLLKKSGIDDEVIKGGENILLTFRGIRNEAGKGNDIFNQATKATLDLSVAFGKDMTSSAILVGKALQDPIAGVSALRRVGVQLNDQQVASIKSFVAQGDVMSAQKVILKELTTEVGGSAKAYGDSLAGQVSKAKEELKNAAAAILSSFVPVMRTLSGIVLSTADALTELPAPLKTAVVGFLSLVAAVGPASYIFGSIAKLASGVASTIEAIGTAYTLTAVKVLEFGEAVKTVGLVNAIAAGGIGTATLALGGFAIAGLAVGAISYGLVRAFDLGKLSLDKWQTAGRAAAQSAIADAQKSADAYASLKKEYANTGAALDLFTTNLHAHGAEINARTADTDALRGAFASGSAEFQKSGTTLLELRQKYDDIGKALVKLKPQHDEYVAQQEIAEINAKAHEKALADLANGTTDWAHALDETKQSVLDLQSAQLSAIGGELGLEQANINLTKAQNDYNTALESGDPSKIADAELNLRQARVGVASATDQAFDSQQKLNDTVGQGWDAVTALIDKKKEEIATYGDSSGAIQAEIDRLFWLSLSINGLPPQKGVNIDLSVNGIESLNYTKDTINDLTSREHRVMVELGGDALGYLTASDKNIKHNITPVAWN